MTDAEKKMKKYTRSIERRLNLPRDVKTRVMSDFLSSINARREAGQSDEEIYAELGDARKAAVELNEQMKEFAYRKSPWRFLFAALAVYGGIKLLPGLVVNILYWSVRSFTVGESASIGVIGGADGPTAIFVTTSVAASYLIPLLLLIVGILGYLRLRKCGQK